jgi:hypothetical protein
VSRTLRNLRMVVAVLHTNAPNSRMVLKIKIWPIEPVAANSRMCGSLPRRLRHNRQPRESAVRLLYLEGRRGGGVIRSRGAHVEGNLTKKTTLREISPCISAPTKTSSAPYALVLNIICKVEGLYNDTIFSSNADVNLRRAVSPRSISSATNPVGSRQG